MRYSRLLTSLLAPSALLITTSIARGAILDVPLQYPTIQAAIDAAVDGDVVLVEPGTYFESLQLEGKAIALESRGGAEVTILDGNGSQILTASSRVDLEARISGFTFTHGHGQFGGAISCGGAWLEISDCRFLDNSAKVDGGALYAASLNTAPILLTRCTFAHNHASLGAVRAIGVAQVTVSGCVFSENGPADGTSRGGALVVDNGDARISGTCFRANRASIGGALLAEFCNLTIEDCSFEDNHAAWDGGAASLASATVTIARTWFTGNTAGTLGGAVAAQSSALELVDTAFTRDFAREGGAVHVLDGLDGVLVQGCTFARNAANSGGALALVGAGTSTITSCILWQNVAATGSQIEADPGAADVRYSDVQGGWPGTGNIDLDPQFDAPVHGELALASGSPCIDAGEPDLRPATKDLAERPRWLDGDLDGTSRIDMGAMEHGNIALGVAGSSTPGGTLTLVTRGSPGLEVFLFVAAARGSTLLAPYGALFIDLAQPWLVFPLVVIPPGGSVSLDLTVPLDVPTPTTLVLQELGIEPLTTAGNLSSETVIEIR
jgi:predicted outer membrane repeat protein